MTLTNRKGSASPVSEKSHQKGTSPLSNQKAALMATPNQHFSMVRNFYVADFLTLMNGGCGMGSVLLCLNFFVNNDQAMLWYSMGLILVGCFFDFLDGRVARWRNESSVLGQELDSLADLISFGVAPACLGFSIGLRNLLDTVCLIYFVICGIARLARYNATVAILPKDAKGKVSYFEGTPIPTSIFIVTTWAYLLNNNQILSNLPGGEFSIPIIGLFFHPLALVYIVSGSCMVSRSLKIPKP